MPFSKFCGLYICHLPLSYKKCTWEKIWNKVPEEMEKTISNKFRTITDLNQFIFVFDSLLSGEFYPMNMDKQGKYINITDENNEKIVKEIQNSKYKRICINDNCSQETFERIKDKVVMSLEVKLPEKSMFER